MRQRRVPGREAWGGFFGWMVAGALFGFAIAGLASIGLLVLPFAIVVVVIMTRAHAPAGSAFGVLAGMGAMALFLGVLSLGYTPCDETGTLIDGDIVYGFTQEGDPDFDGETSCGGWPPWPFLATGAVLTTAGVGLFMVTAGRGTEDEPAEAPPNLTG